MNKILNCAVIGCGAISKVHLDAIDSLSVCRLIAVCDIDEEKAKTTAELYNCNHYVDYKKMLEKEKIDAVHILTPHYLHVPMALYALQAGVNVVLEKPVGISNKEVESLIEAERKAQSRLAVIFQNRYNNTTLAMKNISDSGSMGKFISAKAIVAWHRDDEYYSSSGWRGKKATEGGGLLINQAIHTLDLLRYLGGEVKCLKANVDNTKHPDIEVEDCAMATLYYKSGARATFFATNNHGIDSMIELEMVFASGTLRLLDNALYKIYSDECECITKDEVPGGTRAYWGVSHMANIKSIYNSFIGGKPLDITPSDASVTNKMVFGIYESSDSGKKYYMTEE